MVLSPERLRLNSQSSEQTVLIENLYSVLTQMKMSIPFWLNWNDSWYFVVTVFSWFFEICDKNDNKAKIYPTWECKEVNFDFPFRKGQFPFYCNYKLLYLFHSTLSQLDQRRMFFVLCTKKKTISGFWQIFFSSFGMEVIEESDPGKSIHFESIRTILIHSDICIRANANHSEPIWKTVKNQSDLIWLLSRHQSEWTRTNS